MPQGFYFGTKPKILPSHRQNTSLMNADRINGSLPESLMSLLPPRLIENIEVEADKIEEIRLRADRYASLTTEGQNVVLGIILTQEELNSLLLKMCKGSLYSYAEDINNGFITLDGGVRVGICGKATIEEGLVTGVSEITSLSIRIPHKKQVRCDELCRLILNSRRGEGILIYSPPGEGKTTLLRAMARRLSGVAYGLRVAVIDSRSELGYDLTDKELLLDVLSGYPINVGMEIAARTMNAQVILCDEIGSLRDAAAMIAAHGCGVPLIASAHGSEISELLARPGVRALHRAGIFGWYVRIFRDGNGGFTYSITEGGEVRDGI